MPIGNVLVGNTRRDIEHDDTTLTVDVVSVSQATELLLTGGVPDVELDRSIILGTDQCGRIDKRKVTYCRKLKRVNFYSEGGNVLLLKLSRQMALDKGGLQDEEVSIGQQIIKTACRSEVAAHRNRQDLTPGFPWTLRSIPQQSLVTCEAGTNLACSAVANKHELEAWSSLTTGSVCHGKIVRLL